MIAPLIHEQERREREAERAQAETRKVLEEIAAMSQPLNQREAWFKRLDDALFQLTHSVELTPEEGERLIKRIRVRVRVWLKAGPG